MSKIPDIRATLEAVEFLIQRNNEPFDTHYPITDNIFASATVERTDKACLWLGANVMIEYTTEEARDVLKVKNFFF
jgi:prefoldin subunit 5